MGMLRSHAIGTARDGCGGKRLSALAATPPPAPRRSAPALASLVPAKNGATTSPSACRSTLVSGSIPSQALPSTASDGLACQEVSLKARSSKEVDFRSLIEGQQPHDHVGAPSHRASMRLCVRKDDSCLES